MAGPGSRPTRAQRAGLVLLGLLLPLLLLEVGLRISGAFWTRSQDRANTARLDDDGAIRVLCLGESTTAYGYPAVLERILNEGQPVPPYRVFNEGIAGTTTDQILERLPGLLDRYEPDVVVSMMGINDPKDAPVRGLGTMLSSLRVVELYRLLSEHLGDRWSGIGGGPVMAETPEAPGLLAEAEDRLGEGDLSEAHALVRRATETAPRSYDAWRLRIQIEGAQGLRDRSALLEPANSALGKRLAATPTDLATRLTLARLHLDVRAYDETRALLLDAPSPAPEHQRWRRLLAAAYEFPSREAAQRADWDTAVAELEAGLAKLPTDATLIRAEFRDRIARSEEARGDSAAAEHHTTAARELRGRLDHSFTARSYRTLYDSLRDRRVQLVASQYPGRSIDEVKEMLDGAPDVVFVDNAASFREAIDRHGFWRVYEDEFAGDFGHMTELGKEILARRVADGVRAAAPQS
ncbi:MAG: GDSL-type esterase/lipase family protein [Candidatus Binatia bacterium]|nr:GDSL-type esterase/lipase family protein [Candidatus Binatia bacterium]